MELVKRVATVAARVANNDMVINGCLVGLFGALMVRSSKQQEKIESLEAEKDSLAESNKSMKKVMWDWKQKLYAEASTDSALVPLARLKHIYGEAPSVAQTVYVVEKDANSPASNFVI